MSWRTLASTRTMLRAYPAAALLVGAFLTQPVFAFLPLLLLGFHVYLMIPRATIAWVHLRILTDFLVYFALVALLSPRLGLLSLAAAAPVLASLTLQLENGAHLTVLSPAGPAARRFSPVAISLLSIAILVLVSAFVLNNSALTGAAVLGLIYLAGMLGIVIRSTLGQPLNLDPVKLRLVAGTDGAVQVKVAPAMRMVRKVFLTSPYNWLKISPGEMALTFPVPQRITLTLRPPLSGPVLPEVHGRAVDRFGLLDFAFKINPLELFVIPRARYATWVARRYLSDAGRRPLAMGPTETSLPGPIRSTSGLEYYGSRLYQPGDSLRNIDWKHSTKLQQLVTKEFSDLKGRPALLLVNLAVSDAEGADDMAYKIIATALFLARDTIPAALAAYDDRGVRLTTATLPPTAMIAQSLSLSQKLAIFAAPVRYLGPPDVTQLRTNLFRLERLHTSTAEALANILNVEYQSLQDGARLNPASAALLAGLRKADRDSSLVILSQRNHDAEALAFSAFEFRRRGHTVVEV